MNAQKYLYFVVSKQIMDTERAFRYEYTGSAPVFGDMSTYLSGGYIVDLTEEYEDVLPQIQVV